VTPEERVAPIWERWVEQETISRRQIEAIVRASENDALERAAAAAMRFAGHACEAQSAAMAIRAMKHVLS
jgi:hypothetical protein